MENSQYKWDFINYLSDSMTSKRILILLLITFSGIGAFSQAREDNSKPSSNITGSQNKGLHLDKVMVGGNFGAQFGTVTVVHLNPTVGYKLKENWLAGVSATYLYAKDDRFQPSFVNNIFGGSIFSQYYFLENFIAHAEYEVLNLGEEINRNRINVDAFLVGGGYRSQIGGSVFGNILLLYNLTDDIHYPYSNPIVRIGFGVGL